MKASIRLTLLIFSLTGLGFVPAQAQFLGGFFSQQSKQRELMAEQIVQYEIYLGALKSGYHITESGLHTAHELKNGTFSLHSDYITSLSQVSPVIRNNPKGKTIAELNAQTLAQLTAESKWQQEQKLLTVAELGYLQKVKDNLAAKCQLDMDELLQVLTPGKLQLTDAQRLNRLDKLYDRMKDKYAFAGSFTAKCHKLALSRKKHSEDNIQLKKLHGIQ